MTKAEAERTPPVSAIGGGCSHPNWCGIVHKRQGKEVSDAVRVAWNELKGGGGRV